MNDCTPCSGASHRVWAGIFAAIALTILASGYVYYRSEITKIRQEQYHTLTAIGQLKADQIAQWRKERLSDALRAAAFAFADETLERWIEAPESSDLRQLCRDRLTEEHKGSEYSDVLLYTPDGSMVLAASDSPDPLNPATQAAIDAAVAKGIPALSDLYLCTNHMYHLDTVAPVFNKNGQTIAVLVLRGNAETFLYPMIQAWPTPSQSAETLLVRREGDDVVFLNELRHRPGAALSFRIPLTQTDLPAARAILGQTGIFSGVDYRGVKVLAQLAPIPDTSWFMVAKIDASEIMAEARYHTAVVAVVASISIILAAAVLAYIHRQRQARVFQELYQAERRRREAHEQFRTILYSIGDAVITTDHRGRVQQMNTVAEDLTGWPEAEAEGKPLDEVFYIIQEGTRAKVEDPARRVLREGQVVGLANHTLLVRRDGTERPVADSGAPIRDENGVITGVVLVFRDQTEERASEQALRESQEDLNRAQAVASTGSWRLNVKQNELRWSDENHRIFGLPKGTPLTYETFLGVVYPDDRAFVDEKWQAGLRGEPYDVEHRIVVGNEVRWVRERAELEFDENGELLGGFGTTQDITALKHAEHQLKELNESLEQRIAERTEEVQQLAVQLRALATDLSRAEQRERKRLAKVLHDHIQQLLVAARMHLEWAKRAPDKDNVLRIWQDVDAIVKEALDASRSLTVELSPPALHEAGLVAGLNWLASKMFEKHQFVATLRLDKRAEPASEEIRFLLFECVRELLFNAVKHAGTRMAEVTAIRSKDGHITVVVEDDGNGFDPNVLRHRKPSEATFGLFSIQQRLAHIDGKLEIQTAPGEGTRITLTAPAGEAQDRSADNGELVSPAQHATAVRVFNRDDQCRVLIVDDHKIVHEGLVDLLQFESGIEVVGEAATAAQAIRLAETIEPDVIVMDVNLNGVNGVEATRIILSQNPRIKVIGLSMHEDGSIAEAMAEAGAAAYLTKGCPSEDLIAAIRACIAS